MLFTSRIFQQIVLQESLNTIKPSCTEDHHKSYRTQRQSEPIFMHRVTECLIRVNNRRESILSRIVLIPFYNHLLEEDLL